MKRTRILAATAAALLISSAAMAQAPRTDSQGNVTNAPGTSNRVPGGNTEAGDTKMGVKNNAPMAAPTVGSSTGGAVPRTDGQGNTTNARGTTDRVPGGDTGAGTTTSPTGR